jgi:hypothetical protein
MNPALIVEGKDAGKKQLICHIRSGGAGIRQAG